MNKEKGGEIITIRTTIEKDADGVEIKKIETVDTAQQCSLKISRNAKGQYSSEIKIYEDDPKLMEKHLNEFQQIRDRHAPVAE